MTIGALKRQTSNFLFNIVNFDFGRWHSYEHENWDNVDAIIAAFITGTGLKGLWRNSTIYATSDRVIDPDTSAIYLCLTPHTSAATPTTFSADRVANPTYWRTVAYEPQHRGQWLTATVYGEADFVSDAGRYGYVTVDYLSGASYNADVAGGKIETLLDLSTDPIMLGKADKTGTSDLTITKGSPRITYHDNSSAANTRRFASYAEANTFGFAAYNDAGVWQRTLAYFNHAGGLVTSWSAEFLTVLSKHTWPGYEFWDTDGGVGAKRSLLKYDNGELSFIRLNDAGTIVDFPWSSLSSGIFQMGFGGQSMSDFRIYGVCYSQRASGGSVRMTTDGGATRTGWLEWRRQDNTRLAYLGYTLDGDYNVYFSSEGGGGAASHFNVSGSGVRSNWGWEGRAGVGGSAANWFNIYWTGSVANLWIDSSDQGSLVTRTNSFGQGMLLKVWGHTNPAGTTINDSYNISSLTDAGTGEFVYNFTSAMANAVYSYSSCASMSVAGYVCSMVEAHFVANRGASAIRWRTYRANSDVLTDLGGGGCCFGDQA